MRLSRQFLLILSSLLVCNLLPALGVDLEERDSNVTIAAPLAFAPDQNWDGIDGTWSSFTLRVGTPAQFVRTFISFQSYQTWVIAPEGCATAADVDACAEDRGWIFDRNDSSTFETIGIYDTWIAKDMGYDANAVYGYDAVGLGGQGEGGPTLSNTTVGSVAVEVWWFGMFGINPKPTNFTDFAESSPSYMTQLKEQGQIPSVSFGYTAGAPYRFTGVLASLTLGGYDTSKYVANNVTFTFDPDNERDTTVAIQSIRTPSRSPSSPTATELLPNPIYALIDSTLPGIYLPMEACLAFEEEFGLIYENTTGLYLVNDTLHDSLLDRNANVTFVLAKGFEDSETVQITLPYAAFDLTARSPFKGVENDTNYFPLMRSENDSDYVLGRTFMQEAYITVAYEASRFQIAQTLWDQNARQNLVAIAPFNSSQPSGDWTSSTWGESENSNPSTNIDISIDSSSGGISGGAIAGIVIGVVAVLAILVGLFFWRRYRKQHSKQAAAGEKTNSQGSGSDSDGSGNLHKDAVFPKAELAGSQPLPFGMTHHEADKSHLHGTESPTSRAGTPYTATTAAASGPWGHSSAHSPTSPSAGEGTQTSSQSGTLFSPTSAASEAASRNVYEMMGDMPEIREKDGKQLSEKEALRYRENVYNGVDSSAANSPTTPAGPGDGEREARRVNPDDIVNVETGERITRNRAFSFEGSVDENNLHS